MRFCQNCGIEVDESFCWKCGNRLNPNSENSVKTVKENKTEKIHKNSSISQSMDNRWIGKILINLYINLTLDIIALALILVIIEMFAKSLWMYDVTQFNITQSIFVVSLITAVVEALIFERQFSNIKQEQILSSQKQTVIFLVPTIHFLMLLGITIIAQNYYLIEYALGSMILLGAFIGIIHISVRFQDIKNNIVPEEVNKSTIISQQKKIDSDKEWILDYLEFSHRG